MAAMMMLKMGLGNAHFVKRIKVSCCDAGDVKQCITVLLIVRDRIGRNTKRFVGRNKRVISGLSRETFGCSVSLFVYPSLLVFYVAVPRVWLRVIQIGNCRFFNVFNAKVWIQL